MFTYNRQSLDLNGTWKFNPDPYMRCQQQKWWLCEGDDSGFFPCYNTDGLWDIEVPGTWKTQFEELKWYDGHANYVKEFHLEDIPNDKEAFLCFDGVVYACDIYLNGKEAGHHDWGYSPFQVKVTELLQKENRLFVLVDNLNREDRVPGIRYDWNNDGGIIGPVKLILVPKTYVENFRTWTTLGDDTVEIGIEVMLKSADPSVAGERVKIRIPELEVETSLVAQPGKMASTRIRIPREELILWSPSEPKLYTTEVSTRHETLRDEIGFREIKTAGQSIFLNGEELRLYGVAVHSEFPGTGRTSTKDGIELMLDRARQLGVNFLRCAHYPYSDEFARAMDRAGMLWWEEVPVYWLPKVHLEPQKGRALGMLKEMVLRDWNRASLIFWSVSNECAGNQAEGSHTLEDGNYPYWVEACRLVRELDPSRLISSADSGYRRTRKSKGTPDSADTFDSLVHHYDWFPAHPDAFYELLDVLGANLYVANIGDNPIATEKLAGMLRKFNKPIMITEFGAMSVTGKVPPERADARLGSPHHHETILREGYAAFYQLPEIVGYVPWALMDVRVPMHWRWYNKGSATFAYGLLDNTYSPKPVFAVVQEEIKRLKEHWHAESVNLLDVVHHR